MRVTTKFIDLYIIKKLPRVNGFVDVSIVFKNETLFCFCCEFILVGRNRYRYVITYLAVVINALRLMSQSKPLLGETSMSRVILMTLLMAG
jgi:hypothetical protein